MKTTQKAQDCPNVQRYFKQANDIVQRINQAFRDNEITWNKSYTDIKYDRDLKLEL